MKIVKLPLPCPWVQVGPYLPGIEYEIEDDTEANRLVSVKGFVFVTPEEEE